MLDIMGCILEGVCLVIQLSWLSLVAGLLVSPKPSSLNAAEAKITFFSSRQKKTNSVPFYYNFYLPFPVLILTEATSRTFPLTAPIHCLRYLNSRTRLPASQTLHPRCYPSHCTRPAPPLRVNPLMLPIPCSSR